MYMEHVVGKGNRYKKTFMNKKLAFLRKKRKQHFVCPSETLRCQRWHFCLVISVTAGTKGKEACLVVKEDKQLKGNKRPRNRLLLKRGFQWEKESLCSGMNFKHKWKHSEYSMFLLHKNLILLYEWIWNSYDYINFYGFQISLEFVLLPTTNTQRLSYLIMELLKTNISTDLKRI